MRAELAFAMASALHAGFQLTVTLVVYPTLAARSADDWAIAHARHSRAITPVVVLVYGALLVTGVSLVLAGPGPAAWVGIAGAATAMALTAGAAAPLHGRLTTRDDAVVARLLLADRVRCVAAVVGSVAALLSVR